MEAGDHVILIGRVIDFDHNTSNPLGFCRGSYVQFGLERDAVAAPGQQTRVGAILERDGKILLVREPGGDAYTLPTGATLGNVSDPSSLLGRLGELGVGARDLVSVRGLRERERQGTVGFLPWRNRLRTEGGRIRPHVRFRRVALDRIRETGLGGMLRRYVAERTENRFGIYVGDNERGQVHALSESYF